MIRYMQRLEELLRQMCQAAKAIGNTELENKFAEGTTSENGISCMTIIMFSLMWAAMIYIIKTWYDTSQVYSDIYVHLHNYNIAT